MFVKKTPEGIILKVRVHPRAKKNKITGLFAEERVKISITAPPVEGAANEGCIDFFSQIFKLNRSKIKIISGQKNKDKIFLIKGIELNCLMQIINKESVKNKIRK